MFHILSSSASFTSVMGYTNIDGARKAYLFLYCQGSFTCFFSKELGSLSERKVLENKNITLWTAEKKKQTITLALQSELLLLEFALDECCNSHLTITCHITAGFSDSE